MKFGVAGMSVASYDIDKLEATPLDHMIDDILGLLSNPISDRRWVARDFRVRRTHGRTSKIIPHALSHAPQF